ncbi:MAG: DUF4920 domain-containing protein [Flavobacteriaceae bacterium]|nr:DUF4920 domain-containing protein [Flavobacteriaceae bacterium]
MKNLSILLLVSIFFIACQENSNKNTVTQSGEAVSETTEVKPLATIEGYKLYGLNPDLTPDTFLTVSDFSKNPEALSNNPIKLKIEISEVCQNMGCWVTFPMNGEMVRVQFRNHFSIPKNSAGREAIIYGLAKVDTISVADQKHYLEDQKNAGKQADAQAYATITASKVAWTFDAEGILIKQ